MMTSSRQAGFTAVELLITLFVAAAFLIAGFQLFNVVIRDGGQARAESLASNVAYDYMRQYTSSATNPCSASTPLEDSPLSVDGLSNAKITITISCTANSSSSVNLSKIEATITFNSPQQTVRYATYINSADASTAVAPPSDITNGLVGWWQFNGSGTASVGTDAMPVGPTLTTSPTGLTNGAYSFDGIDDYMYISNISTLPTSTITLSFWAQPAGTGSVVLVSTIPDATTNRIIVFLPWSGNAMWDFGSDTTRLSTPWNGTWSNTWAFWTFTASPSGRTIYRNGTVIASNASNASFNPTGLTMYFGRRDAGSYWNGSLDDVRIYNRVLTPTEITTLYTQGAK